MQYSAIPFKSILCNNIQMRCNTIRKITFVRTNQSQSSYSCPFDTQLKEYWPMQLGANLSKCALASDEKVDDIQCLNIATQAEEVHSVTLHAIKEIQFAIVKDFLLNHIL